MNNTFTFEIWFKIHMNYEVAGQPQSANRLSMHLPRAVEMLQVRFSSDWISQMAGIKKEYRKGI